MGVVFYVPLTEFNVIIWVVGGIGRLGMVLLLGLSGLDLSL